MRKLTMDELNRISKAEFEQAAKTPIILILDNIRSLSNVGAFFRTADAFRIKELVLCGITACPPHREIHKTALGAEESVAWSYHEDTVECVRKLKEDGYGIFAVEQVDDSIKLGMEKRLPLIEKEARGVAIILGNEIEGVQEDVLPLCDGCLEIPQYGTKHSLNVSCAASIVIWEMFKQLKIENNTNH
jgi:tRNA G18 (ribose-2'-O)-methylase SpoU